MILTLSKTESQLSRKIYPLKLQKLVSQRDRKRSVHVWFPLYDWNIKGKGKQEENELQNHGLAMVNLSPLLYPGVKSVRGTFSVQPYTDQTMLSSGFTASIAEEMHRSGSSLQLDQKLKSGMVSKIIR